MPDSRADVVSYSVLYRQWEEAHWSATGIDFSVDAEHWLNRLTDVQRASARWHHGLFVAGVERVSHAVTALLDAAGGRAERSFLATQAADTVRHQIFLEQFLRRVAGRDPVEGQLTWALEQLLDEVERSAEALRRKPKEKPLRAQTVVLCHVLIEGVLAIPGNHFVYRYLDRHGLMPGLATGMALAARDAARHVAFGARYLSDLLESKEARQATLDVLDKALPWMIGVFVPPGRNPAYAECFDFSLRDIYAYGLRSLETRLGALGIGASELWLLARDDRSLSYEERARRALVLVEAGVLGDDRQEPVLGREALEILFEGMARSTDVEAARSLGGPVEWAFTDAEPWHLAVAGDHVEAKPGRAGEPALRLEAASGDWARMVVGRTDSRWAVLTRRLRVHGALAAKAKLPKLFH